MNRAVIYARVSTERQRDKHTIDSQLSVLPEIIKQKGYNHVYDPYIDDGISGETIIERPAMLKLLEDAEQGLFDAVFVVDIDRLTRSRKSIDWEIIKDTLRKGNVKLITPGTHYNFEDLEQELSSDFLSRISAYEKKKIIQRMMRGKKEKAKQGKFIGGIPLYGYTYDEDTKEYEIVEDEAKVIRNIFDLCIQGKSIRQIPKQLNDMGISTPTVSRGYSKSHNNSWASSTVKNILNNPAYAGEPNRWVHIRVDRKELKKRPKDEWFTTEITPIISRETFELALEALKSRQVLAKRNSKREYLLSGLIFCETCGSKMTGECSRGKKELLYYVCQNGRRKHLEYKCPIRSVRAPDIEEAVWGELKRLLKTPELLKKAILESKDLDDFNQKKEDLAELLKIKENEEERLLDLYQHVNIDKEKLIERIDKLNNEKANLRKELEAIVETNKVDTRLKTINELKIELEADIDAYGFDNKRRVLEILLHGKKGVGVFIGADYSVEIRGLVNFSKLNDLGHLENNSGLVNTSYL